MQDFQWSLMLDTGLTSLYCPQSLSCSLGCDSDAIELHVDLIYDHYWPDDAFFDSKET